MTTTTISKEQEDAANLRVKEADLSELVTVLGSDFRDLDGSFDKLVSVEMIEAVDWRLHGTFFSTCQRLLKPEGLMLLQAIVIEDTAFERAKHHDDFVRRMIFPGGCLPSVASLRRVDRRGHRVARRRSGGHRAPLSTHAPALVRERQRRLGHHAERR